MDSNIDILIYAFRKAITEETNNSNLPLSVKAMIIKELYDAVNEASIQKLTKQLEQLKQDKNNNVKGEDQANGE